MTRDASRAFLLRGLLLLAALPPVLALSSCNAAGGAAGAGEANAPEAAPMATPTGDYARATFAGGCFWCMEQPFDVLPGVVSTTSGYTGGEKKDPTYEEVSAGVTGHAEAVQVLYDPKKVSYEELLEVFWRNIDPTTSDRQFCDIGRQYRPAIFVHDGTDRRLAEESKVKIERTKTFPQPILVPIVPVSTFYPAEEYHQDFYKKSPIRYKTYRFGCGRDARLKELWGAAASHG